MSKLSKIKEELKNILLSFAAENITTDKGIIVIEKNGEEIAVGDIVRMLDADGNEVRIEDGEYNTENTTYVIKDGRIEEIKDIVKEEETVETEEVVVEAEEEKPAEDVEGDVEAAVDEIEALKARIAELEEENAKLKGRIAELEKEPAVPSAEEQFNQMEKQKISVNDRKMQNLNRLLNA